MKLDYIDLEEIRCKIGFALPGGGRGWFGERGDFLLDLTGPSPYILINLFYFRVWMWWLHDITCFLSVFSTVCHISKGETESLQQADDEDISVGTFNFNSSEAAQQENRESVSRNLGDLIRVPGIVKVLSPSVLNKIAKDPLFSVNVAQNVTEEVKVLVQTVLADQEDEDYGYFEDFNYDVDYDYDTAEAAVGNILDGLDPGLLASISPDLLIAYFESATVDDVKSILKDSTILLSLSPKTVVELLKKLPEETVTTIVNSDAVQSLYSSVKVMFCHLG